MNGCEKQNSINGNACSIAFYESGVLSRLAGKYRWREFPVVITGNYRPGKYSKFWQSGKYWEI